MVLSVDNENNDSNKYRNSRSNDFKIKSQSKT